MQSINFPVTIKWSFGQSTTHGDMKSLRSELASRLAFETYTAEELELDGSDVWASIGSEPEAFESEAAAIIWALLSESCEIIRKDETEDAVMESLKIAFESNGFTAEVSYSNLSESRYVIARSETQSFKVRLSNHDLPDKYAFQAEELTHDFRTASQVKEFAATL